MAPQPAPHRQGVLDIGIEIQRDVNGIEMGVLENGVPFLTQTGLAKISGVARSVIFDREANERRERAKLWLEEKGL